MPAWAGATLDLVGQMAIPLMLLTLGVAIARLKPSALAPAFWLCLVKLAICTIVPLGVGLAFGLPRQSLAVLVLQVATPVAVTSYMLAAKYDARPDEVAGLVVVSTLLVGPGDPAAFSLLRLSFRLEFAAILWHNARRDVRQDTASS